MEYEMSEYKSAMYSPKERKEMKGRKPKWYKVTMQTGGDTSDVLVLNSTNLRIQINNLLKYTENFSITVESTQEPV